MFNKYSISFDGIDGTGKTTFVNLFTNYCKNRYPHLDFLATKEPMRSCETLEEFYESRLELQMGVEIPFLMDRSKKGFLIKDRSFLSSYETILNQSTYDLLTAARYAYTIDERDGFKVSGAFTPDVKVAVCFPYHPDHLNPEYGQTVPFMNCHASHSRQTYNTQMVRKGEQALINYGDFEKLYRFYEESPIFTFRIRPLACAEHQAIRLCEWICDKIIPYDYMVPENGRK